MKKINLVEDTITREDINSLITWLSDYPQLTKGPKTIEFEKNWSEWLGSKYSVFVNSGSSANLLMLYALKHLGLLKNKKICVPSLSWATDLAPVLQFDLEPILIDCNLDNLSVDLNHLETTFEEQNPSVLILVSVLGLSPDMDSILKLCEQYDVILLEDNCESQGTSYKGKKLGNFGLMSSFSTFFGHTMSTIEGGVITTNDEKIYHTLLQLRSHGWSRDLPITEQKKLQKEWNCDDFSNLYTFFIPGFNLRSTDLQAQIGINQLAKIDEIITKRNENFKTYKKILSSEVWFPNETQHSYTANFAIPILTSSSESKKNLIKELIKNEIACRPLISGSMGTQPFYKKLYGETKLPNCTIVDNCGIYVPNHPNLEQNEIKLICDIILNNK
jgi:CDP-6-deoxy-D-xylo-4-hexulose-3-dehydrase